MIGKRLKLARSASGLSLRDLSGHIGNLVTAQAIGKYERCEAMPGSRVLLALAEALDVTVDYLAGDQDIILEGIEFRKKQITSKKEEAQVEAKVLHLLERYLMVEEILNLSSLEWDQPREAPYPVNNIAESEHAAQIVRAHWGLGLDPIPNLVELFEEYGLKVLSMDLTNIDGLSAHVRRSERPPVPVIVVNRQDWGERQRFTLAHELGHMVLDVVGSVDAEKASHRFAGALLMPAEALWSKIGKHRTSIGWGELFELKTLFRVSVQALTYRCKDLCILSDGLLRKFFREFSDRGWRNPPYQEPLAFAGEAPKRFQRLCYRALAENAISEPKAAELLGISVHDLNRQMDEPPDEKRSPARKAVTT